MLKQVRAHLIETAKPQLQSLVEAIAGVHVASLHHDISTVTGEAFVDLTFAESPLVPPSEETKTSLSCAGGPPVPEQIGQIGS